MSETLEYQLGQIASSLHGIEARMDRHEHWHEKAEAVDSRRFENLEKRQGKVEATQGRYAGAVAVISASITAGMMWFTSKGHGL